ncbi:hypothetical protein [Mycolicibacterium sp. A43C]
MSAEFPALAEVLKRHRPSSLRCYPRRCRCKQEYTDWEAHLAAAWRAARAIETAEQLDSLPIGSVVRELEHPVPGIFTLEDTTDDQHGAERCWYVVGDGRPTDPTLPALLIDHPEWARP